MKVVSCDRCGGPAVLKVRWIGGGLTECGDGHEVTGEWCSQDCLRKAIEANGSRRPRFEATRELLERQAYERALDDEGAPPLVGPEAEASLPYTPPFDVAKVLARKVAKAPPALSHASRAADVVRQMEAKS